MGVCSCRGDRDRNCPSHGHLVQEDTKAWYDHWTMVTLAELVFFYVIPLFAMYFAPMMPEPYATGKWVFEWMLIPFVNFFCFMFILVKWSFLFLMDVVGWGMDLVRIVMEFGKSLGY
jgi:hypothetical protein